MISLGTFIQSFKLWEIGPQVTLLQTSPPSREVWPCKLPFLSFFVSLSTVGGIFISSFKTYCCHTTHIEGSGFGGERATKDKGCSLVSARNAHLWGQVCCVKPTLGLVSQQPVTKYIECYTSYVTPLTHTKYMECYISHVTPLLLHLSCYTSYPHQPVTISSLSPFFNPVLLWHTNEAPSWKENGFTSAESICLSTWNFTCVS